MIFDQEQFLQLENRAMRLIQIAAVTPNIDALDAVKSLTQQLRIGHLACERVIDAVGDAYNATVALERLCSQLENQLEDYHD